MDVDVVARNEAPEVQVVALRIVCEFWAPLRWIHPKPRHLWLELNAKPLLQGCDDAATHQSAFDTCSLLSTKRASTSAKLTTISQQRTPSRTRRWPAQPPPPTGRRLPSLERQIPGHALQRPDNLSFHSWRPRANSRFTAAPQPQPQPSGLAFSWSLLGRRPNLAAPLPSTTIPQIPARDKP